MCVFVCVCVNHIFLDTEIQTLYKYTRKSLKHNENFWLAFKSFFLPPQNYPT